MMEPLPLILASSSPRRRQLLAEAGYEFTVVPPHESAECGVCSRETPPELVARLAFQKAGDVAMPQGTPEAAYQLIHGKFTDEQRAGMFKPEVPVGDDASPQDRLLAYTGRDPR